MCSGASKRASEQLRTAERTSERMSAVKRASEQMGAAERASEWMSAAKRASEANEQANEWAVRANERTEEQVAQYSTRRFHIIGTPCAMATDSSSHHDSSSISSRTNASRCERSRDSSPSEARSQMKSLLFVTSWIINEYSRSMFLLLRASNSLSPLLTCRCLPFASKRLCLSLLWLNETMMDGPRSWSRHAKQTNYQVYPLTSATMTFHRIILFFYPWSQNP